MPLMDKRVLILSLSSIVVLKIKQIMQGGFNLSCCFCKRFSTIRILCIQISHLAFLCCEIVSTHSKGKQEQRS